MFGQGESLWYRASMARGMVLVQVLRVLPGGIIDGSSVELPSFCPVSLVILYHV